MILELYLPEQDFLDDNNSNLTAIAITIAPSLFLFLFLYLLPLPDTLQLHSTREP